jgi:hypothetical protein
LLKYYHEALALDHQLVLLVNLSKVNPRLCKLKPRLTFDKLLWREACPKIKFDSLHPREPAWRLGLSLGCARASAELNLRPGLSMRDFDDAVRLALRGLIQESAA